MSDDGRPQRPLPECLTRFLSDPVPQALPAQPVPHPRPHAVRPRSLPAPPNRALRIFLAWALAYNVLGFTIIVLLWQSLR
ncbi:hypothetical protein ASG52_23350 [Methylobacterium sp. Leaf456]|uniref:hypothetical protein n=1 Tax=Methylobacterium sp. Leaf456 TaxID=1736382 RepID=UPI000712837C|nr:hypothetical protein [Methylobacterium sp. Leaf456]KQT57692.1 hypothetical protein ASG52_23350 [Methylobacterium sp. Leaf456]